MAVGCPMNAGMKVGLAQINPTIGDFPGNAKKLVNAYREALDAGADLVISPELGLVGYPPRDLLFKSRFIPQSLAVLEELAKEVGEVPFIVGYVDHADGIGKPFTNSAAILVNGEVHGRRDKMLLPTYDVFDEQRYFTPATENLVWEYNGVRIGISICEDIWTEDYLHRPLYKVNPITQLVDQGVDVLVNLSASPYSHGKQERRINLLSGVAKEAGVPLFYCNAVGGNDQLIFDGGSLAFCEKGELIGQSAQFAEQTLVVDSRAQTIVTTPLHPMEELYEALVLGVRDYATKCGFSRACLGLSGGIDSALTAVLACAALGGDKVHGLTMPSPFSSEGSVNDSLALAHALGMRCDRVGIAESFESVKQALAAPFDHAAEDVTEENMQARIRGLYLMSLSNKTGALLLTTGNKSELAVGYCTIYGDMCGGLAVISDLPKTLVYDLCRWINREQEIIPWNTIDKPPSAELRPDQTDQDSLPEYDVLDTILEKYVEEDKSADEILAETGYEESLVRWVQRRVDLNEWKRHQAAPGLRVTTKAFGVGRRMPIAQRFRG